MCVLCSTHRPLHDAQRVVRPDKALGHAAANSGRGPLPHVRGGAGEHRPPDPRHRAPVPKGLASQGGAVPEAGLLDALGPQRPQGRQHVPREGVRRLVK